jgi:alpha-tubulin suppressor-like RCC1 family protein
VNDLKESIARIAAGANMTVAITLGGSVAVWGTGKEGSLGLGINNQTSLVPVRLGNGIQKERFVQVSVGAQHCAALTENGHVWTWGCISNGRLGRTFSSGQPAKFVLDDEVSGSGHYEEEDFTLPGHVVNLKDHKIVLVGTGESHSMALSATGLAFAFGDGFVSFFS